MLLNRVKEERWKQNLTDQQLADKCGITQAALNKIENGLSSPRHITALMICRALEKRMDELFVTDYKEVDWDELLGK